MCIFVQCRDFPDRPVRVSYAAGLAPQECMRGRPQWRRAGSAPPSGSVPMTPWTRDLVSAPHGTHLYTWLRSPGGSAPLLDADQVARGIAEGAVANTVRLLGRLLDNLGGVAGLEPLEGAVEIIGGQKDPAVCALGHHLGDGAALLVGDAGIRGRRRQEDGRAGLAGGADGDPAHLAGSDVGADLEAEGVAIEGQGGVRVVVREETCVNGDVHVGHASCGPMTGASRFLIGLVTCLATHGGIPAVARAASRR